MPKYSDDIMYTRSSEKTVYIGQPPGGEGDDGDDLLVGHDGMHRLVRVRIPSPPHRNGHEPRMYLHQRTLGCLPSNSGNQ